MIRLRAAFSVAAIVLGLAAAAARSETFESRLSALSTGLRVRLAAAKPPAPPSLPSGTPKDYVRLFGEGWRAATRALNNKNCEKLFLPHGVDAAKALETMKATEYRFLALPQGPNIGAQTNGPDSVFINTKGLFVTAVDGRITLDRRRYDLRDVSGVRGMILLHELGHQLKIFGPDAAPDQRTENARHSLDVIHACVPSIPVP